MALSIVSQFQLGYNPADRFNDQLWLRTLETLLPTIRNREDNVLLDVSPAEGLKYQGDLYGLLQAKEVPTKYHWIVMRLNGYSSTVNYDGRQQTFLIPSFSFIDEQLRLYMTTYRKNT